MKINPKNLLKAGIFFIFLLIVIIIFHVVVGFLGINYLLKNSGFQDFSVLLSIFLSLLCVYFKIFLPLSIGTFFGIVYVLDWHWTLAILITMPGLFFLFPKKLNSTFNFNTFYRSNESNRNYSNFNRDNESVKTNVKNSEIIDGEYKVINDENEKDKF